MEFLVDALPVELIEMNSTMMCNYIKFSVLTESWSPLDAIDTSKSATLSHGWRCQPSGKSLTSLRNMFENTQSLE